MKLINGDCLEEMKQIPDKSIDMILTDPPYLINYCRHVKGHRYKNPILNDKNSYDLISNYIKECFRIQKNNSNMFCFSSIKQFSFFEQVLLENSYKIKNIIIWDKLNGGMGDTSTTYAPRYEILFYCEKGKTKIKGKRYDDIWQFAKIKSKIQVHQNQKPIEILERCIINHSNENDVIFDGFMGSGSTGVACVNTNRNFIGIELDKTYFDIASKRINEQIEMFAYTE